MMYNEINAIDFISMIVEIESQEEIEITFAQINLFRDALLQEGYSYDLGLYDFEELEYNYPENICIHSNYLTLKINGYFMREMSRRKSAKQSIEYIKIMELWKM